LWLPPARYRQPQGRILALFDWAPWDNGIIHSSIRKSGAGLQGAGSLLARIISASCVPVKPRFHRLATIVTNLGPGDRAKSVSGPIDAGPRVC